MTDTRIPETQTDQILRETEYDLIGEYRKAVSLAGFDRQEQVLDVGTGSARMAAVLSQAGYQVLSGDIDPETLERARTRLEECGVDNVILCRMDAEQIEFDADTFSSVMCANAIHHMANPDVVLSEMARICKPDGKLVVIEFTDTGFLMLEHVHRQRGQDHHGRGILGSEGIEAELWIRFHNVKRHKLKLNNVWIASEKRQEKSKLIGRIKAGRRGLFFNKTI